MAIKPLQSITLKNDNGEDTTYVVASAPAIVETTEPASVASFADGAEGIPVSSLIADINPVQNLNGQSAPYPAGGGKNKYPISIGEDVWVNNANATHSNNNGELVIVVAAQSNSGVYGNGQQRALLNQQSITKTVSMDIKASVAMSISVQGNIFDASTSYQRISVVIAANTSASLSIYGRGTAGTIYVKNVAITEDGSTAYAPYSNICPITGWTGMNVYRTGKNLIPSVTHIGSSSGVTYTVNADGSISLSGTATATSYFEQGSLATRIPLKAGKYYISGGLSASVRLYLGGAYADGDAIPIARDSGSGATLNLTKTANVYLQVSVASGTNTNGMVIYPMISTVQGQAYEPYNGTTYPISWADEAGTVYGGTLDVTTGLLTVTHQIVDLGDLTWSYNSSSLYFNADLPVAIPKVSTNVIADILCTAYAPTKFADMYNNASGGDIMVSANNGTAGNKKVYVTDKAYTDPAAFKSAVAGVKLVYAVLTPTTYQLTPQAVLTILGQNNIWADTGDVEVAYCADTKLYIDKVLTE